MKKKRQYRIRNWRAYNTVLINRGSLTLGVAEEALTAGRRRSRLRRRARAYCH